MNNRTRLAGLALQAALLLPQAGQAVTQQAPWPDPAPGTAEESLARGGGRGGGRSGAVARPGGSRGTSGSRGIGGSRGAQTGFQGVSSGLNRGHLQPSGGWGSRVQAAGARPSLDRPAGRDLNRTDFSRTDFSRGNLNRTDLNRNRDQPFNRDGNRNWNRTLNGTVNAGVNRNWSRTVNIGDVDIHPGWARPGWGVARPWNHGWYGSWNNPPWGWWGARAAVWGIGTLATATLINSAVDAAIDNQVSTIVVPNTSYELLYGSVAPSGSSSVTFAVSADGSTYQLSADCQAGTINGQDPASAAEAELLNAACQVAFGST